MLLIVGLLMWSGTCVSGGWQTEQSDTPLEKCIAWVYLRIVICPSLKTLSRSPWQSVQARNSFAAGELMTTLVPGLSARLTLSER